jgi:NAD(P)-dependent dehydrogenase (short-subunit alcohol dehydrogenase family)
VTGGASGTGRATATRLVDARATVLIADLNVKDGTGSIRCDVSDPTHAQAAVDAAVGEYGGLDILSTTPGSRSSDR